MTPAIYLPRWGDVLVQLLRTPVSKRYCQKICREVETSSNHVRAIVSRLAERHLIEIIPTRKIKRILVTDKGRKIALAFQTIKSELR